MFLSQPVVIAFVVVPSSRHHRGVAVAAVVAVVLAVLLPVVPAFRFVRLRGSSALLW
jgi:hypothetical protein